MSVAEISSVEDAIAYLQSDIENSDFKLSEELLKLKISVSGERYDASIPAELARGLWQYQEALYKAVAFTLYGVADIRRLTTEQREDFELNFNVGKGSTELLASIAKFLDKLGENMDSKDKKQTIITIALLIAGGFGGDRGLDYLESMKKIDASAQQVKAEQSSRDAVVQTLASLVNQDKVLAFQKAAEEGGQYIVKGADDADKVEVPGKTYTRDDIVDLTQRSPREVAETRSDIKDYKIVMTNTRSMEVIKLGLLDQNSGEEMPARFIPDDMTIEDTNAIWAAAKSGENISLEVSKVYRKESLVKAEILSVRSPN